MKVLFLYLFIFVIIIGTALQASVVIKGQIKTSPKKWLTVFGYADYFSGPAIPAAQVQTDTMGNFQVSISDAFAPLVKLQVENKSLNIYVLQGGEYVVNELADGLVVKDIKGIPVNEKLGDLLRDLEKNWLSLFIDSSSGRYKCQLSADSMLKIFGRMEAKYLVHQQPVYNDLIHYMAAVYKLSFITFIPVENNLLTGFENNYFNNVDLRTWNPFYMKTLEAYLGARINYLRDRRYQLRNEEGSLDRVVQEAGYFKNDCLRDWAIVAGCSQLYGSGEAPAEKKKYADGIQTKVLPVLKDMHAKEALKKVILRNNQIKLGDPFPILSLKNEKGALVSFADIRSDLILVDFWGSWCPGCIAGMRNFPDWMEQCKGKLTIVSIAVDETLEKMTTFLDKQQRMSQWVTLYNGREGNYLDKLVIHGYPTYFILNKTKEIIAMPGTTDRVAAALKLAL